MGGGYSTNAFGRDPYGGRSDAASIRSQDDTMRWGGGMDAQIKYSMFCK